MSEWTQEQHDAARARCDAAPEGPWSTESLDGDAILCGSDGWDLATDPAMGNWFPRSTAAFIAHARTDVPALLDEVERLRDLSSDFEAIQRAGRLLSERGAGHGGPHDGDEPGYESCLRCRIACNAFAQDVISAALNPEDGEQA